MNSEPELHAHVKHRREELVEARQGFTRLDFFGLALVVAVLLLSILT